MTEKPTKRSSAPAGAALILASAAALGLIAKWEPAKDPTLVYADKLAGGLPTVCNGITKHVSTIPVIVGERWTWKQCAEQERNAVLQVQRQLLRCFVLTPPQSVFDAATSHAWNLGASRTCQSGAMQAWNAGDWRKGCWRIGYADSGKRIWSSAGGKFVRGLAFRRDDEIKLCLRDVQ